jgi:hypothetical protein
MEEQFREICGQQRHLLVAGKAHADKVEAENAEQKNTIADQIRTIGELQTMLQKSLAVNAALLADNRDLLTAASGCDVDVDSD